VFPPLFNRYRGGQSFGNHGLSQPASALGAGVMLGTAKFARHTVGKNSNIVSVTY